MKTRVIELSYEKVQALPIQKHKNPRKPSSLLRHLALLVSEPELKETHFTWTEEGMDRLGKDEPCLILMNHSCFLDLKIALKIFKNRPYNIVCTNDGFVGREWQMRAIGCIPTHKFVPDVTLVHDMVYCVEKLRTSILLYPEASYSFDGTQTDFSSGLAKIVSLLKVPVVTIITEGAFQHDPLYNNLQTRKVNVSAKVKYLLSEHDVKTMSVSAINTLLRNEFKLDYFAWQRDNNVLVNEPFRADSLNRVLYKCPACLKEGKTVGKGTTLTCTACGKTWTMKENGQMEALNGETEYPHIPDWYRWQRQCVRKELLDKTYKMDVDVDIYIQKDNRAIYKVGEGHLSHTTDGFFLTGCADEHGVPQIQYHHRNRISHSLYADYFWYERGDMVCIGTMKMLYYCFPKNSGDIVAKSRLATEEMFKLPLPTLPNKSSN